ncbi:MAG: hypothetical protein R2854_13160 [Caldilineaceae bacterium]
MPADSERWARRQYGWGIAFAVALAILLLWWLLVQPPAWLTPAAAPTPESGASSGATGVPRPEDAVNAAAVAAAVANAEATLAAAAQNPVDSMEDVMDAAQTVVAAPPVSTPAPPIDGGVTVQPEPQEDWIDRLVGELPAFTALVTFVGLVFTSLMKWRTDLHETGRQRRRLELEQHELALDRQQMELDHLRTAFELERQKLDYELARKKLELRALEEQAARVNRQIGAADS